MQGARSYRFFRLIYLAGDLLILNASFFVAYYLRWGEFGDISGQAEGRYPALLIAFNGFWVISTLLLGIYNVARITSYGRMLGDVVKAVLLHVLIVATYLTLLKLGFYYSRILLFYAFLLSGAGILLWRVGLLGIMRHLRAQGYNLKRVVIIGNGELSQDLLRVFQNELEYGYTCLGVFDDNPGPGVLGGLQQAKAFILQNDIEEIYCALPNISNSQVQDIIQFADAHLLRINILPDLRGFETGNMRIQFYGDLAVFALRNLPLDDILNRATKRTFDIAFSLCFIVFVSTWLFPILALLVRLSSPGPVFFRQRRLGKDNQAFDVLKFRTMVVNTEADSKQATKNDARITPIGSFMRKTSLDELPQFFNVLWGHMSIVGPRPHPIQLNEQYAPLVEGYMERHLVKPGITGLAQAKGFRGETPTVQYMKNRVKMDRFYVDNWSLLLDIKIILLTVFSLLRGDKNAY